MKLAWELMHNQGDVGVDEWIAAEATIKQALAAPVQEPVAVVTGYHGGNCVVAPTNPARLFNSGTAFYTTPPAAPVQEPVPEGSVSKGEFNRMRDDYNDLANRSEQDAKDATRWRKHVNHCQLQGVDLDYQITTPQTQQKPWVDMSDEEIDALAELYGLDYMSYDPFVRALNAKLREKNT
jgi:type 1 glutamine amidotransferase